MGRQRVRDPSGGRTRWARRVLRRRRPGERAWLPPSLPDGGRARVGRLHGKNVACSGATTLSDSSGLRFKPGLDFAHETDGDGIGQALAFAGSRLPTASSPWWCRSGATTSVSGRSPGAASRATYRMTVGRRSCAATTPTSTPGSTRVAQARVVEDSVRAALGRVTHGHAPGRVRRRGLPPGADDLPVADPAGTCSATQTATGAARLGARSSRRTPPGPTKSCSRRSTAPCPRPPGRACGSVRGARPRRPSTDTGCARWGRPACRSPTSTAGTRRGRRPGRVGQPGLHDGLAPHQIQESLHPDYWGAAAERACLRLVLTSPSVLVVGCTQAEPGLRDGDPVMVVRSELSPVEGLVVHLLGVGRAGQVGGR